jgi:hypothetical protein
MPDAWTSDLAALEEQSGGVLQLSFFDPAETLKLLAALNGGSGTAARYCSLLIDFREQINTAPQRRAARCLVCDKALMPPLIFGIALPHCDRPGVALMMGFCRKCGERAGWPRAGWQDRLSVLAAPRFRELWPGSRFVDPVAVSRTVGKA